MKFIMPLLAASLFALSGCTMPATPEKKQEETEPPPVQQEDPNYINLQFQKGGKPLTDAFELTVVEGKSEEFFVSGLGRLSIRKPKDGEKKVFVVDFGDYFYKTTMILSLNNPNEKWGCGEERYQLKVATDFVTIGCHPVEGQGPFTIKGAKGEEIQFYF